jgi:hypothetical protein
MGNMGDMINGSCCSATDKVQQHAARRRDRMWQFCCLFSV